MNEGLERGERVAFYSRDGDASLLPKALAGRAVEELEAAGRLVVGSAEQAYFGDGAFDGYTRAQGFAAFTEQTLADGYPGLRVYADNGWMPAALDNPTDWLTYELRIAAMVPRYPLIGLCGFDSDDTTLTPEAIDAVHAINVNKPRPLASFRVEPQGRGFAFVGELDRFNYDQADQLLQAAAPLLHRAEVSLAAVTFADAASASSLFHYLSDVRPTITDVAPALVNVWRLLGLTAPRS